MFCFLVIALPNASPFCHNFTYLDMYLTATIDNHKLYFRNSILPSLGAAVFVLVFKTKHLCLCAERTAPLAFKLNVKHKKAQLAFETLMTK